ncbi:DNA translocase FtsK [Candidatus Saccharibacteria bacterium]|nr:DNA translocase FtsK [Candidatus Saccharibacteria bacterium]MCL1963428.1 DNA translocase FtsK [Candidatus Saccharibacteria bacterium]
MGKHRGPGRPPKSKKTSSPPHSVPGGFWRQVSAILLILLSILILVGLFGAGGDLLSKLAELIRWIVGWTAFVIPFIFFWQAIQIFRSEENKLPGVIWVTTILLLVAFSGLFQLFLEDPAVQTESIAGNGGGMFGWMVASGMLGAGLNVPVTVLILSVLIAILLLFVLGKSPKHVITAIIRAFGRESKDEENNRKVAEANNPTDDKKVEVAVGESDKERMKRLEEIEGSLKEREKNRQVQPVEPPKEIIHSVKPDNTNWQLPGIDILSNKKIAADPGDRKFIAKVIEDTLEEHNIHGEVVDWSTGPRVTQYYLQMQKGTDLSAVASPKVEAKLKMNLAVESVRIEAPVPGRPHVGIEVPNKKSAFIGMRSIIESTEWNVAKKPLTFAVGQDISGRKVVLSLTTLPHLLIAGTTGSGKSVMMNLIVASLLYRYSPDELKFLMVDPKGTEMAQYQDMPHLMGPVRLGVSKDEVIKISRTLTWTVDEMNKRYDHFREKGVKDYKSFRERFPEEKMPYLVVVIDEWTSLLDSAKNERDAIVTAVQQIAQKGRAAGLHEIIMMQAPRAKYIQGSIRANITAGICFTVLNKMESQQIIQTSGGEKLLGQGDMLLKTVEIKEPKRIQSAFVEDEEIEKIVLKLKLQSPSQYDDDLIAQLNRPTDNNAVPGASDDAIKQDPLFIRAVQLGIDNGELSASDIQTFLGVGFGRSKRMFMQMEQMGMLGDRTNKGKRTFVISSVDEIDDLSDDMEM